MNVKFVARHYFVLKLEMGKSSVTVTQCTYRLLGSCLHQIDDKLIYIGAHFDAASHMRSFSSGVRFDRDLLPA